jgi:hypothetical protein
LKAYDERWVFCDEPLMVFKFFDCPFNILSEIQVLIYFAQIHFEFSKFIQSLLANCSRGD